MRQIALEEGSGTLWGRGMSREGRERWGRGPTGTVGLRASMLGCSGKQNSGNLFPSVPTGLGPQGADLEAPPHPRQPTRPHAPPALLPQCHPWRANPGQSTTRISTPLCPFPHAQPFLPPCLTEPGPHSGAETCALKLEGDRCYNGSSGGNGVAREGHDGTRKSQEALGTLWGKQASSRVPGGGDCVQRLR